MADRSVSDIPTWFFHPGAIMTSWLLWLVGPGKVIGLENVPRQGPYLLVANHCSNFDPPMLGWAVGHNTGRVIHFMAKDEMRSWFLVGWMARSAGTFFVRRGAGDRGAQRLAQEVLRVGRPLAIFPEGTRSRDGQLNEPRLGAAMLAMTSDVPVLPVGISGTHRIFPGRSRWPHRSPIAFRIGQPFRLPHTDTLDRSALREGTDRIMREIAALLPPDQRGKWEPI
ncbi:MAG TPA: lysophospholipid acyltransferase family protein [Candidatus Limnocylindrales bacterium]|nr:lysophospholipid acyltransferase family protein [Candidatus Limnocylindrales bacterium]